jgi:MerR family transcriptional regulator, redox-sensitive transcriptional activator SoxR
VNGVHEDLLTIGELARQSGRSASSIRYYEQIGLLPEPVRISGQRRYSRDTVRMLGVIHIAQHAGLSLEQIKSVLAGPDAVAELRSAAAARLPELSAMIERATQARDWLELAAMCQCPDLDECPLFSERLERTTDGAATAVAAVHRGDCQAEGPGSGGCLEHARA